MTTPSATSNADRNETILSWISVAAPTDLVVGGTGIFAALTYAQLREEI